MASSLEKVLQYSHTDHIWACAISPDGGTVASASRDNRARAFRVEGGEEINLQQPYSCTVYDVSIGGDHIATADYNGVVYVQKLSDPSVIVMKKESYHYWARSAKLSPDGSKLAFSINQTVFIADVATQETLFTKETNNFVVRLAANKDQTVVFVLQKNETTGSENFLRVWDVEKGKLTACPTVSIADSEDYPGIATNATGDLLAIADSRRLRLWKRGPNDPIRLPRYSPPERHCACALTPDGKRLVASMGKKEFGVWDCETKTQIFVAPKYPVGACAISDNGKTIAVGCTKNGEPKVHVLSLTTKDEEGAEACVDNVLKMLRELLLGENGQSIRTELKKLVSAL